MLADDIRKSNFEATNDVAGLYLLRNPLAYFGPHLISLMRVELGWLKFLDLGRACPRDSPECASPVTAGAHIQGFKRPLPHCFVATGRTLQSFSRQGWRRDFLIVLLD
ncbi:predicted protein [Botrytis cinerea T4]|uniref:Uncharacterized protein n=1 Tax=Botryotinia fuckeliana (strain T4) TaxID=999810 RepID=G2YDT1_BOTF4|nr:predicted protein [Botrytis cinerea T4]